MFRLSLSILPILLSGCLSTCHNGIAENVPQHSDSSLYLNNTIQVGDTAMRLVERGIMTPDIENKNLYNLVDNTFLGINFNRSIVSTYNGLVNGLFLFSRNFDKESENKPKTRLTMFQERNLMLMSTSTNGSRNLKKCLYSLTKEALMALQPFMIYSYISFHKTVSLKIDT